MSTPRTDAAEFEILSSLQSGTEKVVNSYVARELERELAAERAKAAQATKDAERYRWLQTQSCKQDGTPMSESCYLDLNPRDMDAAIDAAMQAPDADGAS